MVWRERLSSICSCCVFNEPADVDNLQDLCDNLDPQLPSELRSLLAETDGVSFQLNVGVASGVADAVINVCLVSSMQGIWEETNALRNVDANFNNWIVFGSMPDGDYVAYRFDVDCSAPDVWVICHENASDRYRLADSLGNALETILRMVG